jgi:GNAT superfamily N-acetyltransferase
LGTLGAVAAERMQTQDVMREATPQDLAALRELERAAGAPFRGLGMDVVADDEPPSVTKLSEFQADGRAWVWTDSDDVPVAYILVDVIDDEAHIEQVSVHPDHARQRLGQRLIDHVEAWARTRGLALLTLTTYRNVPWNAPYYARLGFDELEESAIGPGLQELRGKEADRGLDRWPRVAMRKCVPPLNSPAAPPILYRTRSGVPRMGERPHGAARTAPTTAASHSWVPRSSDSPGNGRLRTAAGPDLVSRSSPRRCD